jgi:hypothetical protein
MITLADAGRVVCEDVTFTSDGDSVQFEYPLIVAEKGVVYLKNVEVVTIRLGGTSASLIEAKNNLTISINNAFVHNINSVSQHPLFFECVAPFQNDTTDISITNSSFEGIQTCSLYGGLIGLQNSPSMSITILTTRMDGISVSSTIEG